MRTSAARLTIVARLILLLAVVVLLLPDSAARPATFSLTKVESAKHVDFEDGVVWFLALGSDARPGQAVTDGRADAIQLVGVDLGTGNAVGIGVPRDSWVDLPEGFDRINAALPQGGPDLVAAAVADLVGITPDYVFVSGFDGFRDMVGAIGGVEVQASRAFADPEFDLTVEKGPNRFDATEALDYARSRKELPGSDFERSANQQQLMLGILRELRAHENDEGFMEGGALAALGGLDTNLPPTELYRLALAVTQVEPGRVTIRVIGGTPLNVGGAEVIEADVTQARRLAADAREDARLQGGCRD
ncbi:MAG TPA: LCP family protein [Nocardioides sp.]|nr:LCP family protein [Nocardioides sp.]